MTRSNILAVAVTVSLAFHLVLFLMVPGMRLTLPASTERVVEVEVAEPQPEPQPQPEPEPPPPEPLEPREAQAPPLAPAAADSLSELLAGAVATAPLPPPTAPAVRLPRREALLPEADTLSWSVSPPPGPSTLPRANVPRVPVPGAPDLAAAEGLAQELLAAAAAQAPEATPPEALERLKIEWQKGVERRVTHEPPAPSVPIRNPADVRIQFWVSPRGTVTRAEVLQTADPDLDRAALAYVKAFRFNDLPPGQDQEQWGTIRVSFRLE